MGDDVSQPGSDGASAPDPSVTFACVLYRGEDIPEHSKGIFTPEWVDRLYRGIKRNCTRPFRFVCYVDDDYEFSEPVVTERLVLPYRNMFSLLEPFREKGRVVFMGLDTIITGNIDFLADYDGPFRMLKDPWQEGECSGVMLFPPIPGLWADIERNHAEYAKRETMFGYPSDMVFLNGWPHQVMDGPSNGIYSYKAHIKESPALIDHAKVVYFHGREKPHELSGLGWVDEHWGPPIDEPTPYAKTLNNAVENHLANIRKNLQGNVPQFNGGHGRNALICCGGPSLEYALADLKDREGDIFATNGVHDYLLERGIVPRYHVILDSRPENVCFVENPDRRVRYLLAAEVHPSLYEALEGYDVTMWHTPMSKGIVNRLMVCGGATVGLKSMYLAHLMGYRDHFVYGMDSCYIDERDHAYPQDMNTPSKMEVTVAGRTFVCDPWMVEQAKAFQKQARTLADNGCRVYVHGDGLIAWISKQQKEST